MKKIEKIEKLSKHKPSIAPPTLFWSSVAKSYSL